jgi:imidazolonepropionase-like amidohydrolase
MERRPRQRVRVEGATIVSIDDDPMPDRAGPFAGAFALPGLIDVHVHFPPPAGLGQTELFAFLFLYHGVTTVRDAGDIDGKSTEPARSGVASGRFPGPRVFACGPFVDGEGAEWSNSQIVLRPAQADAVVEEIARDFDCVKAYDHLTPDVAAAVREAGRRRGIAVIGHVPLGSRFEEVHLDEVQHMMGMAFAEGEEGPFPKSLEAWGRRMDEARMKEIVSAALRRDIALTPTLVALDRTSRMDDLSALSRERDARVLPRYYLDVVWAPGAGVAPQDLTVEDYAAMREALAIQERLVKRLYDAGARLYIGTDVPIPFVVPGASLHRELTLFVDAGLTPEEAWALATRSNGALLGVRDLGRLAPGAPADLLHPRGGRCTGTPLHERGPRRTARALPEPRGGFPLRHHLRRSRAPDDGPDLRGAGGLGLGPMEVVDT